MLVIVGSILLFVFLLTVTTGEGAAVRDYADSLRLSQWAKKPANSFLSAGAASTGGEWNDQQFDQSGWVIGSGRRNLTYNSPFNRDDYSLTEDECDVFFPELWKEIDRSVEYFTTKQK